MINQSSWTSWWCSLQWLIVIASYWRIDESKKCASLWLVRSPKNDGFLLACDTSATALEETIILAAILDDTSMWVELIVPPKVGQPKKYVKYKRSFTSYSWSTTITTDLYENQACAVNDDLNQIARLILAVQAFRELTVRNIDRSFTSTIYRNLSTHMTKLQWSNLK